MTYARTSLSAMMVPNQDSGVFHCKTTMWSCLSGTACSHVFSRTSSCFGACYLSSFLENLATPSHRIVLQTFFSDMLSLKYPITNRIWISGRYDGWNIPNSCILFPACTAIVPISHGLTLLAVAVQDHLPKWTYHESHPFPVISKIIHCVVFNKVVHIIHSSPSMPSVRTPPNNFCDSP